MKRKLMAVLCASALVMGLMSGATIASADEEEVLTVGIINNDPNESGYRTVNVADFEKYFGEDNEYGFSTSFFYSSDNEEQIQAAEDFITDEVDYLLISAAATTGWEDVLEEAQEKGVTVILFDRMLDADEELYAAAVVSNMAEEGVAAVTWMESQELDEYNIIHIQGVIGSDAQIGRTTALDEAVEENDNWNYAVQQSADWSAETAQEIVQSVIDSGESFNIIYAENDDMAKGAEAALDANGITHGVDGDVIIMGFDCNIWALEALLTGSWNYDGQCNPFQAESIVEIIQQLEAGEELEEKIIYSEEAGFDAATITQEDVDNYGI